MNFDDFDFITKVYFVIFFVNLGNAYFSFIVLFSTLYIYIFLDIRLISLEHVTFGFVVWLARRNIFVASHNRSTDSHACSDSRSLPRPTNVARYKITQQEQERQLPMSLRSPQQLVSCFGRPHLFTPRSVDPGNIIGQQDRVYKHAER